MDFQSAMETFAEAWVAANTKVDPVQSQALALTHKATPPSRSSSVSPIPRSPQSHQTAHATNRSPTPRPASVQHPQLVHQPSQQQGNLIASAGQPRTEHQHQHQHQHQHHSSTSRRNSNHSSRASELIIIDTPNRKSILPAQNPRALISVKIHLLPVSFFSH
ncbi:GSCOCG00001986001-RA-CDS [Cotesia congregata]|nr:GSCOCG00001986001-RA-CDS [Cotesia congregata]